MRIPFAQNPDFALKRRAIRERAHRVAALAPVPITTIIVNESTTSQSSTRHHHSASTRPSSTASSRDSFQPTSHPIKVVASAARQGPFNPKASDFSSVSAAYASSLSAAQQSSTTRHSSSSASGATTSTLRPSSSASPRPTSSSSRSTTTTVENTPTTTPDRTFETSSKGKTNVILFPTTTSASVATATAGRANANPVPPPASTASSSKAEDNSSQASSQESPSTTSERFFQTGDGKTAVVLQTSSDAPAAEATPNVPYQGTTSASKATATTTPERLFQTGNGRTAVALQSTSEASAAEATPNVPVQASSSAAAVTTPTAATSPTTTSERVFSPDATRKTAAINPATSPPPSSATSTQAAAGQPDAVAGPASSTAQAGQTTSAPGAILPPSVSASLASEASSISSSSQQAAVVASLSSAAALASSQALAGIAVTSPAGPDGNDGRTVGPHTTSPTGAATNGRTTGASSTHTKGVDGQAGESTSGGSVGGFFTSLAPSANKGLTATIILLILGAVVGLAILALCCCRRRRKRNAREGREGKRGLLRIESPEMVGRWDDRGMRPVTGSAYYDRDAVVVSSPNSASYYDPSSEGHDQHHSGNESGNVVWPLRESSKAVTGQPTFNVVGATPLIDFTSSSTSPKQGADTRVPSSDWSSFIGDQEWANSEDDRSRQDSHGSLLVPPPATGYKAAASHPLRSSFVPTITTTEATSSNYSDSIISTPRGQNDHSSLLQSPDASTFRRPEKVYGEHNLEQASPRTRENWRLSLDRVMGAAADFVARGVETIKEEDDEDRYTSFSRTPTIASRRAAPLPPVILPAPARPTTVPDLTPNRSSSYSSQFAFRVPSLIGPPQAASSIGRASSLSSVGSRASSVLDTPVERPPIARALSGNYLTAPFYAPVQRDLRRPSASASNWASAESDLDETDDGGASESGLSDHSWLVAPPTSRHASVSGAPPMHEFKSLLDTAPLPPSIPPLSFGSSQPGFQALQTPLTPLSRAAAISDARPSSWTGASSSSSSSSHDEGSTVNDSSAFRHPSTFNRSETQDVDRQSASFSPKTPVAIRRAVSGSRVSPAERPTPVFLPQRSSTVIGFGSSAGEGSPSQWSVGSMKTPRVGPPAEEGEEGSDEEEQAGSDDSHAVRMREKKRKEVEEEESAKRLMVARRRKSEGNLARMKSMV